MTPSHTSTDHTILPVIFRHPVVRPGAARLRAALALALALTAGVSAIATSRQDAPPDDASLQARIVRARTAMMSGAQRPGDLIGELKAILAIDPGAAEPHLLLGLAYRGIGSNDMLPEAIAEFRQALAIDASLVAGRFYLARAYLDLGRAERAREELETALAQAPGQRQFTTLLADAERRSGNPARALELARQVLAADASVSEARYFAAMALLDLDRRGEAIAELEQLVAAGVAPVNVTAALGTAYLEDQRLDEAVKTLELALQTATQRPDLYVLLGRAQRLSGRLADAEHALALALPPGATRQASAFYEAVDADIHLETGLIRLAQDRPGEAEAEWLAALELRPSHGPTHRHLAELYWRQDRRDQAARHASAAREAGETLSGVLATLAPAAGPIPKGQP